MTGIIYNYVFFTLMTGEFYRLHLVSVAKNSKRLFKKYCDFPSSSYTPQSISDREGVITMSDEVMLRFEEKIK